MGTRHFCWKSSHLSLASSCCQWREVSLDRIQLPFIPRWESPSTSPQPHRDTSLPATEARQDKSPFNNKKLKNSFLVPNTQNVFKASKAALSAAGSGCSTEFLGSNHKLGMETTRWGHIIKLNLCSLCTKL